MKHYTNSFRENAQEMIDDLTMIGVNSIIADPGPSSRMTGEEIKEMGMGIVGIWVDTEHHDPVEFVNSKWDEWLANNPYDDDDA